MLWLGWADTKTKWSRGSLRVMEEAHALLAAHLRDVMSEGHLVLARASQGLPNRTQGERCALTLEAIPACAQHSATRWAGAGPPVDALAAGDPSRPLAVVQLTVCDGDDNPVAGARLIEDGLFTLEEIRLALRLVYQSHEARPGCYPVLASARRPLPALRPRGAGASTQNYAVFHCENRACRGFRQEVLVSTSESTSTLRLGWGIAYPCPSCPGGWQARWTLSFKRPFGPQDLVGLSPVVDYPIPPTRRRRGPFLGPMPIVENEATKVDLDKWVVQEPPARIRRFIRTGRFSDLHAAMREDPERCGSLLPGLLTTETFRSLVESTRRLPPRSKRGGIATALARGWYPRRVSTYQLTLNAAQETHHPYIALEPEAFIESLIYCGVLKCQGRFLDVGCGIGEKVFLAYALGAFEQCDGLEYDDRTLAVAAFLLKNVGALDPYPINFMEADALKFEHYGRYDVIYMYRPMRDLKLMGELFRRIARDMRPGAVVFDAHQQRCGLKKIADDRFVTVNTHPTKVTGRWDVRISLHDFLTQMEFL